MTEAREQKEKRVALIRSEVAKAQENASAFGMLQNGAAVSDLAFLLDILDAVRGELEKAREDRNEAQEKWRVWSPDLARWQSLYAACVGEMTDAELGRRVRALARESYDEAKAL